MGVTVKGSKDGKETVKLPGGKVYFMQKTIKGDTFLVLADSATEMEDEFKGLYFTTQDSSKSLIQPPYPPKTLLKLVTQNNTLNQCVEAMEVNVDGTGFEFVPVVEGEKPDEAELKILNSFFNEPYPGVSFLNMRRALRRDMESLGFGFLEVLRGLDEKVAALRNTNGHMVRLVKLDKAVQVKKIVERNGADAELLLYERERRFCIRINNTNVYYREFGSSRHLHKLTGEWEGDPSITDATQKTVVKPEDRATELLFFGVHKDIDTAYSVPRWINQLPSVVGSRKAEEQNLEFFDAGGIPPAIIFIQGGTLAKDMADQLKMYLSGASKSNNRAVVVEAQSSSGSMEAAGSVQVKVERFGSERANDSMFSKYDVTAEEHVRVGFRLPPLFLGKAADYNFATAKTAYMVAEAQVFEPERKDFDEKMNKTIVRALGCKKTMMKSNPITLKDVEQQFKAMELVVDKVKGEGLVGEVNKIAGLTLEYDAEAEARAIENEQKTLEIQQMAKVGLGVTPGQKPATPPTPKKTGQSKPENNVSNIQDAKKQRDAKAVLKLAREYAIHTGGLVQKSELSAEERVGIEDQVAALDEQESEFFLSALSGFMGTGTDSETGAFFVHPHEH